MGLQLMKFYDETPKPLKIHYNYKGFWLPNQMYNNLPERAADRRVFTPADHCDSTPWLANRQNEGTI